MSSASSSDTWSTRPHWPERPQRPAPTTDRTVGLMPDGCSNLAQIKRLRITLVGESPVTRAQRRSSQLGGGTRCGWNSASRRSTSRLTRPRLHRSSDLAKRLDPDDLSKVSFATHSFSSHILRATSQLFRSSKVGVGDGANERDGKAISCGGGRGDGDRRQAGSQKHDHAESGSEVTSW